MSHFKYPINIFAHGSPLVIPRKLVDITDSIYFSISITYNYLVLRYLFMHGSISHRQLSNFEFDEILQTERVSN